LRRFFLALSFLTIIPYGAGGQAGERDMSSSTVYYPVVGAVVGALLTFLFDAAGMLFPVPLASALTVAAWVIITGGLHLDGLMDTFDGLGIRGDMARRLEVMRDSRVGAFGVMAAVLLLLLKTAALAGLPAEISRAVIFMAPVAGRAAMVALLATSRYARAGEGLAKPFTEGTGLPHLAMNFLFFSLFAWLSLGSASLVFASVQAVAFLLLRKAWHSRFNGVTGDLLGAACVIHELVALLTASVLF
jgi:adenosylcobinamide-GDP ribazoletransferase